MKQRFNLKEQPIIKENLQKNAVKTFSLKQSLSDNLFYVGGFFLVSGLYQLGRFKEIDVRVDEFLRVNEISTVNFDKGPAIYQKHHLCVCPVAQMDAKISKEKRKSIIIGSTLSLLGILIMAKDYWLKK